MSSAPTVRTRWPLAVALGALGALIVGLVVLGFLWPSKTSTVHNLPVSLSGPAATTQVLEQALEQQAPGTFNFIEATDRQDAVAQIEQRESYGAIVLPAEMTGAPEVLTAPAASSVATQLLNQAATQLQAQLNQAAAAAGATAPTVSITPVVPLSDGDPAGTGLAAASFPLTMGGMIGGVLISLLVIGPVRRLAALAGFALTVSVVLTLIMHTWFDYLQASFGLNMLVMGLSTLATSAFVVGCSSLLGRSGIAVGAIITMFVGNPLASAAAPWQFMPEPWGAIGQFFVPGAAATLTRSVNYFPDANTTVQWAVLAGWVALGAVLTLVGHFRSQVTTHAAERAGELAAA
ncbi:hypothetical protein [Glutamicibacter sp. NPDC087344]|uniref:hypothetical protein n=1 Tax=Glutamicibacter sp. NPDC087344 TaxID=3363994 RepID=UPI0038010D90